MRIRTIKPEFWQSIDMAGLSETAMLLALGLLNYADDEGYFRLHTGLVKAAIFPLREPITPLEKCLSELARIGYISAFDCSDGHKYGQVVKFKAHQVINRPQISKIASKIDLSLINHGSLTEQSLNAHYWNGMEQGMEWNGIKKSKPKESDAGETPAPPDLIQSPFPKSLDTDAFKAAWKEWETFRREILKTIMPTSRSRQFKFLASLGHDGAIKSIEQSVQNGWTGLFELKAAHGQGSPNAGAGKGGGTKADPTPPPGPFSAAEIIPGPAVSDIDRAIAHWPDILEDLRHEIDAESFETWIDPVRCLAVSDKAVWLAVPGVFYRNWIANNYADQIRELTGTDTIYYIFETEEGGSTR